MRQAIYEIIKKSQSSQNRDELSSIKREVCKKYKLNSILNASIIQEYRRLLEAGEINKMPNFERLLRKRSIRTLSGVAPIAVLTKSYPCPGACAYCPRQKDVPVSYMSNEPAVMRAIRCNYEPYIQVAHRLRSLENNAHYPEKIELIVIGGTWSYFPKKYKYWYILNCFKAANEYDSKTEVRDRSEKKTLNLKDLKKRLKQEQKKNEKAKYRIIGLTLETRPDYITEKELLEMRELACTRVEMGVQAIDDDILKLNKRGHGVKEVITATSLLKKYGFKITYHLMPALPGSSPKKDFEMFKRIFSDEDFQPDQIKFYPTVVTKGSLLYRWYKQGKYKAYSNKALQDLIIKCKAIVPRYVRIIRLIRDIPAESIVAGNKITNLRQILQAKKVACQCIRCREPREKEVKNYKINTLLYSSSGGLEYFISADSLDGKTLYGFCRLRLDASSPIAPAIIRELHVYGELVPLGDNSKVQHRGIGLLLMKKAEEIVQDYNYDKIAIISGVGVRAYYRRLGYRLFKNYLIKSLKK